MSFHLLKIPAMLLLDTFLLQPRKILRRQRPTQICCLFLGAGLLLHDGQRHRNDTGLLRNRRVLRYGRRGDSGSGNRLIQNQVPGWQSLSTPLFEPKPFRILDAPIADRFISFRPQPLLIARFPQPRRSALHRRQLFPPPVNFLHLCSPESSPVIEGERLALFQRASPLCPSLCLSTAPRRRNVFRFCLFVGQNRVLSPAQHFEQFFSVENSDPLSRSPARWRAACRRD